MYFERKRALEFRRVPVKTSAQAPLQFGIAGFPDFVAHMNPGEVNISLAERKPGNAGGQRRSLSAGASHRRKREFVFRLQFIDASALFLFLRVACIENNAVARFERCAQLYPNPALCNPQNFAQVDASLLPKTRVDQFLIVGPLKPPGVKATGKGHFAVVGCSQWLGLVM